MLVQQGHELAGDEAEAPSGDQQGDDHAGQDDVAPADGDGQGTAEQVVGPAAEQLALQLLWPGTAYELLHEEDVLRDGQHPAQQQRDGDHDEERREQLARDVGREVDRQEGEHGDERRSQQRHGGALHGVEDGGPLAGAALHVDQGGVVDHDRVIHQHTHRDDDRRQRHALQRDAGRLHVDQGAEDGEDQAAADQEPVLQADEEEQYDHHRQHGENQVEDEALVGHGRLMPLVVDDVEVVALRHILAGLVDVVGHTPGHLHHIAIGDGRDGDAHGRLPADPEGELRRAIGPRDKRVLALGQRLGPLGADDLHARGIRLPLRGGPAGDEPASQQQ